MRRQSTGSVRKEASPFSSNSIPPGRNSFEICTEAAYIYRMSKKITVAIVEDDEEISAFLQQIVGAVEDFTLLGAFDSVESFGIKLPELLPDVVLLDIGLPG